MKSEILNWSNLLGGAIARLTASSSSHPRIEATLSSSAAVALATTSSRLRSRIPFAVREVSGESVVVALYLSHDPGLLNRKPSPPGASDARDRWCSKLPSIGRLLLRSIDSMSARARAAMSARRFASSRGSPGPSMGWRALIRSYSFISASRRSLRAISARLRASSA